MSVATKPQAPAPALEGGELATLDRLAHSELLELFASLDAPDLAEMDGEYAARPLAAPNGFLGQAGELGISNPLMGYWIGKAFRGEPVAETSQGYNYFRHWGRVVRRYPMLTTIAPSRYDARPAFTLVYRAFHSACGAINMVDEVRRVRPGLYLGIGTMGFSRKQRMMPGPFQLEGPQSPYQGDIGRRRPDLDLQRALIP